MQEVTERAREAAEGILARWTAERERSPLDRVVASEFRSRHSLNSRERRWVSEAVYGSARFLRRQTYLLERLGKTATPDALAWLWSVAPASGTLPTPETPREYLRTTLSFPDDMADALETLLGAKAIAAAEAFNAQAPTTLRLNPLRAFELPPRAALPEAVPTRWSPWGLELPHRVNLYDVPGYRNGCFEAQEEASQLAALLTNVTPGQTVVEVGAGAGGKTLALAALMQNVGRLMALDISATRLEELQKRSRRAGVTCVETLWVSADEQGIWQPAGSARTTLEGLRGAADCVLLDAPCTGSGVLRRNPDTKWRALDIAAFAQLQRTLLEQSRSLVAPNGVLVYVTCAFERSQNEEVIEAFLASAAGNAYALEPAAPRLTEACARASAHWQRIRLRRDQHFALASSTPTDLAKFAALTEGPYLRTWPHRHNLDAFFAACLRRMR